MVGRWTRGLLHLLVGGACAALVAWLTFGFSMTIVTTQGSVRLVMATLVALVGVIVVALLLAPPVRAAEVGLASTLLEVPLTRPADSSSWESRRRGLLWAVIVILLGGTSLLALLWCVPQGLVLLVATVNDGVGESLPEVLRSLPAVAVGALGLALLLLGTLGQVVLVALLRALAPRVLGPTSGDLLLLAEEDRARLLRSHELARELHDSIGHSLTAIGVQAEAGARVASRDPAFAQRALEQISKATRAAVSELDEVLGSLREGTRVDGPPLDPAPSLAPIADLLGDLGPQGRSTITCDDAIGDVGAEAARTAYRVVQEALTNVHRHGSGEARGRVQVEDGRIEILVENPVLGEGTARAGGRGLVGMRERLTLAGGTLVAGPVSLDGRPWWRLEASLPARGDS
ncbi:sensor histidine kinase [Ornithinimicrobium faecis]|uniref:sensor histidine kinase n=1 Tax=Ornithinimicrobium faecis TaxID=2934158 RepID=UPI0021179478|nr:histidine kinase [Ornithinimicrobium sp. HY1745]